SMLLGKIRILDNDDLPAESVNLFDHPRPSPRFPTSDAGRLWRQGRRFLEGAAQPQAGQEEAEEAARPPGQRSRVGREARHREEGRREGTSRLLFNGFNFFSLSETLVFPWVFLKSLIGETLGLAEGRARTLDRSSFWRTITPKMLSKVISAIILAIKPATRKSR